MLKRFWNRDGRRLCAAALCVSMVLGNVANTAIAGDEGINTPYEFKLSSYDLYDAIQTAVSEDHRADLKEFQGTAAEDYRAMADSLDLFELNLSGADHEGALKLRAFAELSDEIEFSDEGVSEYILDGSEKIYFLLTNTSDLERKAVISVDEKKYTDVIKVAPAGAVEMDSVDPLLSAADFAPTAGKGGGSGSSGGGGGSSAGGPGAETSQETAAENSSEAETEAGTGTEASDDAGKETEASSEASTDTPTEASGKGSTDAPETEAAGGSGTENTDSTDGAGTEEAAPADGNGDAGNTGDAGTGTGNEENSGTSGEAGSDAGSDTGVDAGSDTGSDASAGSDQSGSEQSSDNSGDSSENGSSDAGTVTASITRHNTYVVMSTATPSDSEEAEDEVDETETDDATDEATPSNAEEASPSNANADIIDGIVYRPVMLNGEAVVLFETTVDEMALNDAAYDWAMDHEVTETYTSDPAFDKATVTVVARKGALPENVTLKVTELEGQEYQDAKDKLDEAATVYDGMMALDIRFVDASSGSEAEIEPDPKYGEVKVFIEMKQEALPADVVPENIEVQHLKEDAETGEIQVEKVADTTAETNGTVEVKEDDAVVAAEFAVESFSTFTITWGTSYWEGNISFEPVDESGNAIPYTAPNSKKEPYKINSEVSISSIAPFVLNREYKYAYFVNSNNQKTIVTDVVVRSGWGTYQQAKDSTGRRVTLKGDTVIKLVYSESQQKPLDPVINQKLAHDKSAIRRPDGTYDLTLTISGQIGSVTSRAKLDIVYILDKSRSMNRDIRNDYNNYNAKRGERINAATKAINDMSRSLEEKGNLNVQFSLVTFSGLAASDSQYGDSPYNDATSVLNTNNGWTSSASDVINATTKISVEGGTNYQAGLKEASELLKHKRDGALSAVIFVSDGDPTYYYDSKGYTAGTGYEYDESAMQYAQRDAAALTETYAVDYFYTIGVGPKDLYEKLQDLSDKIDRTKVEIGNYSGETTDKLEEAFSNIEASVTTLKCTNVEVVDTLSDNVDIVMNGEEPEDLIVSIIDKDKKVIDSGNGSVPVEGGSISASYIKDTKQIKLEFPKSYELEKGYTYLVKAHIKPTEAAYEAYRRNGGYSDTPDPGTGTHAEDKVPEGLYSNKEAHVTYVYNGNDEQESYLMPVIQIEPGRLVIEKTFKGLTESEINKLKGKLKFKIDLRWNDETGNPVTNSELKKLTEFDLENMELSSTDSSKYTYTYTIEGLSPDTQYEVTEETETAKVSGYKVTTTSTGSTDKIGKGCSKTASFTNTYTKLVSVNVLKVVKGSLGSWDESFPFTVSVKVDGQSYREYGLKKLGETLSDNTKFELKHNESVDIVDVPVGATIEVSETMGEYSAEVKVTGTGTVEDISTDETAGRRVKGVGEDTKLEFTNTKNPTIDTGILLDSMPYVVILGIAILGIAVYVVRKRKKDDSDLD